MPRVTTFRRASSAASPSASSTSASMSVRSWPREWAFENVPRPSKYRSPSRPLPASARAPSTRTQAASAAGATTSASTTPSSRGVGAGDRCPQRHVGGGDEEAGLDVRERLRPVERQPDESGRGAEGDGRDLPLAGAQEREPRPGPAERRGLRDRDEPHPALEQPAAPHRPRLRVPGPRQRDVGDVDLEDRGQAGGDRPLERRARGWRSGWAHRRLEEPGQRGAGVAHEVEQRLRHDARRPASARRRRPRRTRARSARGRPPARRPRARRRAVAWSPPAAGAGRIHTAATTRR